MHGILMGIPVPCRPLMTTDHRYENFEVVSIAAKGQVLITVDRQELPLNGEEQVVRTTLQNRELALEFDSGHTLRFVDIPELEVARLHKLTPTLCALENRRVAFAIPFPQPTAPRVGSRPR